MAKITYIPGEIANAAIDEHGNRKPVTRTQHIFDDTKGKSQEQVNKDVDDTFENHQQQLDNKYNKSEVYKKEETYNKTELNNMITTPEIAYKDYDTYADMVAETEHPAGAIYRVANYDGTQVVTNKYAEYSWDGSIYHLMDVREPGIATSSDFKYPDSVKRAKITPVGVITNIYGNYSDIFKDFIDCIIDSNGKIIIGLKKDGTVYYGYDIPAQVKEYIVYLLTYKVDKEENKGLILDEIKDRLSIVDNGSWIEAKVTSSGKVLIGVKANGKTYISEIESPTIDKLYETFSGISDIKESDFIDESTDNALRFSIPELSEECQLVEVLNETQLDNAISSFNAGNNILVKLTDDITITSKKTLENSAATFVIQGCGKSITQKVNTFTPAGYIGDFAFSNFTGLTFNVSDTFITDKGKVLDLSRTEYFEAAGRITDTEGNTFDGAYDGKTAGTRRFLLPSNLQNLEIAETDNVYINFSCWFVSYTCKVLYISDGYLYFRYGGGYNVDGDYYYGNMYTSFCFINLEKKNDSVFIRNNKIYYPSYVGTLYNCGNFQGFEIKDNTGIIKLDNIYFKGASASNPFIYNLRSKLIVDGCYFEGFKYYCIRNYTYGSNDSTSVEQEYLGELYITNSVFENIYSGATRSDPDTICLVRDSVFKDCGKDRSNQNIISVLGKHYIFNNLFEDYGMSAINIGIISMNEQHDCYGITEYNIIRQSEDYIKRANVLTLMDAGAIYVSTNNSNSVIRYNRIINYVGRKHNPGIFCDDGAYNFKIYGNMVENTPNSGSIEARYATGRPIAENMDNVNKVIAENIVDNYILIQGNPNVQNNGCKLGYNIVHSLIKENTIANLEDLEPQYYTTANLLCNGVCKSNISLNKWNIN